MNKKKKVRHSGKLKSYMQWPAVVAVLLVMLDILVFAIDVKAGFLVFCFTAAYWVLMSVLMLRYRPFVLREMIAFCIPVFPDPERDAEKFFHSVCSTRYGWKSTLDE